MGWLILLAVLSALLFVPFGVRGIYSRSGAGVWLLIGPVKFRIFPGNKKEKPTKQKKANKAGSAQGSASKGGSLRDFQPIVGSVFQFLEEFRKKLRVKNLELRLILAGDDPCDLAVNYGRAWAAVGSLLPQLERLLVIKKRNIQVECDFQAEKTLVFARMDTTITLFRAMQLLTLHGIKIIKQLIALKKLQKGGAEL